MCCQKRTHSHERSRLTSPNGHWPIWTEESRNRSYSDVQRLLRWHSLSSIVQGHGLFKQFNQDNRYCVWKPEVSHDSFLCHDLPYSCLTVSLAEPAALCSGWIEHCDPTMLSFLCGFWKSNPRASCSPREHTVNSGLLPAPPYWSDYTDFVGAFGNYHDSCGLLCSLHPAPESQSHFQTLNMNLEFCLLGICTASVDPLGQHR